MISVIIPLAHDETLWQGLISLLGTLPKNSEIILTTNETAKIDLNGIKGVKIVKGPSGRAQQMNAGARAANNNWLWFLHADSRFETDVVEKLKMLAEENKEALYYHTLKFMDDGPTAMKWNEWAVHWRSDFLKMPFGDQGFFIRKDLFEKLGSYREDVRYGEDHVFVWKVRQEGYPVEGTQTILLTSARKYQNGGWTKVTLAHVWHTIKQGVPERYTLLKRQIRRAFS